jgi:putative colanic acid biosynthesis glycosyltransferase
MSAPLVSVILVCRNPGPALRTALESVWQQTGVAYEVIVVDGASTDGTAEWLAANRFRLGSLISEPDTGVYDAMNKGVASARGQWLLFLGADDRLAAPDTLFQLGNTLTQTPAGIVAGMARFTDGRTYAPQPATAIRRNFIHHQSAFYRRELFAKHGSFDAIFRIQADYELNLLWQQAGVGIATLPQLVAVCGTGGLSDGGSWANYREEIRVRHQHFPAWQCWLWDLASFVRFLRKNIIRMFSFHG